MKRLSIILPMYNVEPYVEKCIRSIEDQDISKEDYEIICINDGSPDNCKEIVERLQQEFSNIILIDQVNRGVSVSRNEGIDKAIGKYLMFIDPDDYVQANSFAGILRTTDEYQPQVSFLGYTFHNEDGSIRETILNDEFKDKIYSGTEAYFKARGDGKTDPDRMVGVLFKIDFINENNLRYLPQVPYLEDGEFIARILCLAKRCIFDGHSFYQRTTRRGSATNSDLFHSQKAIYGFLTAAKSLKHLKDNYNLDENQKRFINQPICKFVILSVSAHTNGCRFEHVISLKKKLAENNLNKLELNGCIGIYFYYGFIFNVSVKLLYIILILRNIVISFKSVIKHIPEGIRKR